MGRMFRPRLAHRDPSRRSTGCALIGASQENRHSTGKTKKWRGHLCRATLYSEKLRTENRQLATVSFTAGRAGHAPRSRRPHIPGSFIPASLRAKLALPICLNILRIWAYCRSRLLTSCTLVPEPREMRLRRLPLMTS